MSDPRVFLSVFCLLFSAFCTAPTGPVEITANADACHWCRMTIADRRLAAQLIAPGEEPRLFDDIGCMTSELARERKRPEDLRIYVADYESGRWIEAERASFERCAEISTPMASHIIAHESRKATRCQPVSMAEILGVRR